MVKVYCRTCKILTRHEIISQVVRISEHTEARSDIETPDELAYRRSKYAIVECGCEDVRFLIAVEGGTYRKSELSSLPEFSAEYIEVCDPSNNAFYPFDQYYETGVRKRPVWINQLPNESIRNLMHEIYSAREVGAITIALMGARSATERFLRIATGNSTDSRTPIGRLLESAELSRRFDIITMDGLKAIVEKGHEAVHRDITSEGLQTLDDTLDILENALESLYIGAKIIENIQDTIKPSGRKPRNRKPRDLI